MGGLRTFQAVLLIPTDDNQLYPLTSDELPRVLLPVGGRPLLSYNLELLESCSVQSVLLVIVGADSAAASRISGWVAQNFHERLPGLEIAVVSEAVGSADALRSIFHRIGDANDLLVLFADVLSDVPLGSVAAAHRREEAALTVVFNDRDGVAGGSDGNAGGSAGAVGDSRAGDKGKKGGAGGGSGGGSGGKSGAGGKASGKGSAGSPDLVGLDASGKRLLIFQPGGSGSSAGSAPRQTTLRRALLETEGRVDLCTDLIDSRIYAFRRAALQAFLQSQPGLSCLRRDVLPAFVRELQPRQQLLLASLLPPVAGLPAAVAGLMAPPAAVGASTGASGGEGGGARDVLGSGRVGSVGGDGEGRGSGSGGGTLSGAGSGISSSGEGPGSGGVSGSGSIGGASGSGTGGIVLINSASVGQVDSSGSSGGSSSYSANGQCKAFVAKKGTFWFPVDSLRSYVELNHAVASWPSTLISPSSSASNSDSATAAAAAAAAAAGAGAGGVGAAGGAAGTGKAAAAGVAAAAAVHESVTLAPKATIGPHCLVGEGSAVGEKSSIKRSIIGRHCRIGAHVRVVNSVIMDHVTIGDGCQVQGSVVSSNVLMQERTSVVDCYVGPGFVVTKDYKETELSKKPKAQS